MNTAVFKKIKSSLLLTLVLSAPIYAGVTQTPLFLQKGVDPNVLFNMSIEWPMGGAAYNDQKDVDTGCTGRKDGIGVCYFKDQEYLGYFDPNKCYVYNRWEFEPSGATNSDHECSGEFSGNMMNWATMTAMDAFVWTMTGGYREIDTTSETVIERARKSSMFQRKKLTSTYNVNPSTVTPWSDGEIHITNTPFGVNFGISKDADDKGKYDVRIKVCDQTQGIESNCIPYDDGSGGTVYKPEGLVQRNSDRMRFGVTSYTKTDGNKINGGVLRSNMKYVGPTMPDGSGGTITNPQAETDLIGGLNIIDPNPDDSKESLVEKSGVMPYLNGFSNPGYKNNDPISELYYESIRYFKNLGPTSEYLTGDNGRFPIIDNTGNSTWEDPIQYSCQKNFIIGINDAYPWKDKKLPGTYFTSKTFNGVNIEEDYGEPSDADSDINVTELTNTVGDLEGLTGTSQCIGCTANNCDMQANNKIIPALGEVFGTCPGTQMQNSYYIAGLAYYANTQDIRKDLDGEQNITSFIIDTQEFKDIPNLGQTNMLWLSGKYGGFIDKNNNDIPDLDSEWDSDGDGEPDNYVFATKPANLINALNKAFVEITRRTSSAAAVATNSTRLDTNSKIYQARFDSADWSGEFFGFDLNDVDGSIGSLAWDASTLIPSATSRKIYSFDPTSVARPGGTGIEFEWANLNASQQTSLNFSGDGTADTVGLEKGEDRLDYIRGDSTNEGSNVGEFRVRYSLLGDVINSDPWFVGQFEDFGYNTLGGNEGALYDAFRAANRDTPQIDGRTTAVYFGSNDGMLHAVNAETGKELFTYVPNEIIRSLPILTSQLYGCSGNGCIPHQYFVDGSTKAADAYYDSDWHTVLVGSLGAGGKSIFALDVSTPSSFDESNILWEVSSTQAYDSVDLTEFQANLGYTLPQASIVRLNNDDWAAVVANGYESAGHKAVLYLIDIQTGKIIKTFDTGVGSAGTPNGLSTPTPIDEDGDKIADVVYAGDLLGNLWKFDLTDKDEKKWEVAYSNEPLYKACTNTNDPCTDIQPITGKPQVSVNSTGGVMVYFGTGKYFETNDQIIGASPQVQHFYAIRDNGAPVKGLDKLQEQTILAETTLNKFGIDVRVTTDCKTDYKGTETEDCDGNTITPVTKEGWFMKLVSPVNGAEGERVVVAPLLRAGRIVFVTMIPATDPCGWGGSSWLMELDAQSGSRLDTSPFDIDDDGKFTITDYLQIYDFDKDGDVDNDDGFVPTSGMRNKGMGIIKTPGVVICENGNECKYTSGTSGSLDMVLESSDNPTGRQSWLQIK